MFFLAEESDTYQSVQVGAQRRAQKVDTLQVNQAKRYASYKTFKLDAKKSGKSA